MTTTRRRPQEPPAKLTTERLERMTWESRFWICFGALLTMEVRAEDAERQRDHYGKLLQIGAYHPEIALQPAPEPAPGSSAAPEPETEPAPHA